METFLCHRWLHHSCEFILRLLGTMRHLTFEYFHFSLNTKQLQFTSPFILSRAHKQHIAKTILIISPILCRRQMLEKQFNMCVVCRCESFVINLQEQGEHSKTSFIEDNRVDERLHLQSTIHSMVCH